jgi:pimeloyl-CoA synthetase
MNVATLTHQLVLQRGIIDFLKLKLEETKEKYERVHKLLIDVVSNMSALGRSNCNL